MPAVDPRAALLGVEDLLGLAGRPQQQAPLPKRILFHPAAQIGFFNKSGFPGGVEIQDTKTGEPLTDVYLASIDLVDEESGREIKHLVWFNAEGVTNLLGTMVGALSDDVLSALTDLVQAESDKRRFDEVVEVASS